MSDCFQKTKQPLSDCLLIFASFYSLFTIVNPVYFSWYSFFNNIFSYLSRKKESLRVCLVGRVENWEDRKWGND